jgi:hypothetical protein
MCPEPIQTLKSEPTSQERGATGNSLEETKTMPALPPEHDMRSRESEIPTPDISTAVERKKDTGKPKRESIEREHAVREQIRRRQSATPAPHAAAQPSATSPDHPNETNDYGPLMKALGTTDPIFVEGLVRQLLVASARGANKFDIGLSFTLAVLNGTKPKDELDAMHVAQMTAINMAIIRLSGELARAEYVPHLESITRAINQLARTYTAQLEARKRYLTGGEQKVTVQNVSVTEGGQAILGNVTQAAHGAAPDQLTKTTPALTDARQPAMDIIGESERVPVPLRKKSKT